MGEEISINELMQSAIDAERVGVPVDWRNMCMQIANAAINEINRLKEANEQREGTPPEA